MIVCWSFFINSLFISLFLFLSLSLSLSLSLYLVFVNAFWPSPLAPIISILFLQNLQNKGTTIGLFMNFEASGERMYVPGVN